MPAQRENGGLAAVAQASAVCGQVEALQEGVDAAEEAVWQSLA
jgi:hypothetical protein